MVVEVVENGVNLTDCFIFSDRIRLQYGAQLPFAPQLLVVAFVARVQRKDYCYGEQ